MEDSESLDDWGAVSQQRDTQEAMTDAAAHACRQKQIRKLPHAICCRKVVSFVRKRKPSGAKVPAKEGSEITFPPPACSTHAQQTGQLRACYRNWSQLSGPVSVGAAKGFSGGVLSTGTGAMAAFIMLRQDACMCLLTFHTIPVEIHWKFQYSQVVRRLHHGTKACQLLSKLQQHPYSRTQS